MISENTMGRNINTDKDFQNTMGRNIETIKARQGTTTTKI